MLRVLNKSVYRDSITLPTPRDCQLVIISTIFMPLVPGSCQVWGREGGKKEGMLVCCVGGTLETAPIPRAPEARDSAVRVSSPRSTHASFSSNKFPRRSRPRASGSPGVSSSPLLHVLPGHPSWPGLGETQPRGLVVNVALMTIGRRPPARSGGSGSSPHSAVCL